MRYDEFMNDVNMGDQQNEELNTKATVSSASTKSCLSNECQGEQSSEAISIQTAQETVGSRYQILSIAGKGGFGSVFKARDTRLDRVVAIKFIVRQFVAHDKILTREASAGAKLNHNHLVRILDVETAAEFPYLVMEWIDGRTLYSQWGQTLQSRVGVIESLIAASAEMHEVGLIHGDLKPANILLDKNDRLVIVDFGLTTPTGTTNKGKIFGGTPGYGAPEQFAKNEAVGPEADVWAIGVMLFYAITNQQPFHGTSGTEVIEKCRDSVPVIPESIAPGCPEELQRIALKALERDSEKRYPNSRLLLADLRRYIRGDDVLARPSILEQGFFGGLVRQQHEYDEWLRLGLITSIEADRASRLIQSLHKPESDWILESRRLTYDRVSIYFGCWLLVLAVGIGLSTDWQGLNIYSVGLGSVISIGLLTCGLMAIRMEKRLLAILLPFSGILATSAFIRLIFVHTEFTGFERLTSTNLSFAFPVIEMTKNSDFELFVIGCACISLSVACRLVVATSAFTLLSAISLVIVVLSTSAIFAPVEVESPQLVAQLLLWTIPLVLLSWVIAINLDRKCTRRELSGVTRVKTRDAATYLMISTMSMLGVMVGISQTSPKWYWLSDHAGDYPEGFEVALASLINGGIIYGMAIPLSRLRSYTAKYITIVLRWLVPFHVLGSLVYLESFEAFEVRSPWILSIIAASIFLMIVSVSKHWKPFLFSGLFGFAFGFSRFAKLLTDSIEEEGVSMPYGFQWMETGSFLTSVSVVAGVIIVVVAIRWNSSQVAYRLSRWLRIRRRSKSSFEVTTQSEHL